MSVILLDFTPQYTLLLISIFLNTASLQNYIITVEENVSATVLTEFIYF